MFYEMRTYSIAAQCVPNYLDVMEARGNAMVAPIKAHMVAQFQAEIGRLNQIISLYKYDSFEQRAQVRAQAMERSRSDEFKDVPSLIRPLLVDMESRILLPTMFSPMR